MEFKTLFYAGAVFLWLLFKYYEKKKELQSKEVTTLEPEILKKGPSDLKPVKQKPVQKTIVNKEFQADIKSFDDKVEKSPSTKTEQKINANVEQNGLQISTTLADDIREGNVDWRKAILLSEILRPV